MRSGKNGLSVGVKGFVVGFIGLSWSFNVIVDKLIKTP